MEFEYTELASFSLKSDYLDSIRKGIETYKNSRTRETNRMDIVTTNLAILDNLEEGHPEKSVLVYKKILAKKLKDLEKVEQLIKDAETYTSYYKKVYAVNLKDKVVNQVEWTNTDAEKLLWDNGFLFSDRDAAEEKLAHELVKSVGHAPKEEKEHAARNNKKLGLISSRLYAELEEKGSTFEKGKKNIFFKVEDGKLIYKNYKTDSAPAYFHSSEEADELVKFYGVDFLVKYL